MKKPCFPPGLYYFLLCLVLFFAGICTGPAGLPFSPGPFFENVILQMRAIRMATAFTAGGALALSGLLFQTVLRNPLAEPFTLGLSGGAAVGAALAFLSGAFLLGSGIVALFAFAGASIVLFLVLLISRFGRHGAENLLLSGVIAGTVASGILMCLVAGAQETQLAGITWWMLGDLQGSNAFLLRANALLLAGGTFAARFFAGDADALSLGDAQAWDLGVHPRRLTLFLTLLAALLAAGTVAMAGIIGFCGLVVPHIMRRIHGASLRRLVFPAVFGGGAFLMFCDIASRMYSVREIPAGVITSLIGGPLFLWILNRNEACDAD